MEDMTSTRSDSQITKTNIKIQEAMDTILCTVGEGGIKSIRESKKEMWLYNPRMGYYLPTAESYIESYCAGDLKVNDKMTHVIKNVKGATAINRDEFNEPDDKINIINGVLDLKTKILHEHSPKYNFKGCLNVKYDPKADCPAFKSLIEHALPDEKDRRVLQKIFGSILEASMREEKSFFLVGKSGSSKSTIVRCALIPLLGKENLCNFSLQAFDDDPYAVASLYGKKANICMDMRYETVKDVGVFKELTGQDMITGRQPFERHFSFFNTAKLLFVCNKLPPLSQNVKDDGAFWRRVIIILFEVQHDETDKDLDTKIMAELPGILNWALDGLELLWKEGFQYEKDPSDIWTKNNADNNPLSEFFNEYFEVGDSNHVVIDDAWSVYLKWCGDHEKEDKDILKQNQFGWTMHRLGAEKTSRNLKQLDGSVKSTAIYSGICWKDQANAQHEPTKRKFENELILTQYIKALILGGEFRFAKKPAKEDSSYLNLVRMLSQKVDNDVSTLIKCVDAAFNEIYPGE